METMTKFCWVICVFKIKKMLVKLFKYILRLNKLEPNQNTVNCPNSRAQSEFGKSLK